jgi:hypothetical protein
MNRHSSPSITILLSSQAKKDSDWHKKPSLAFLHDEVHAAEYTQVLPVEDLRKTTVCVVSRSRMLEHSLALLTLTISSHFLHIYAAANSPFPNPRVTVIWLD